MVICLWILLFSSVCYPITQTCFVESNISVPIDLVPGTHQYLLTVMSIWWCLGQLFVSLVCILYLSRPWLTNFFAARLAAHSKLLLSLLHQLHPLLKHGLALPPLHSRRNNSPPMVHPLFRIQTLRKPSVLGRNWQRRRGSGGYKETSGI